MYFRFEMLIFVINSQKNPPPTLTNRAAKVKLLILGGMPKGAFFGVCVTAYLLLGVFIYWFKKH